MRMQGAKQTNLIAQRTADHLHPHTGREPGIMLPAPRQKLPEISPILKADTVRLHVSREKDKEIALGRCRWDDTKVVQPDGGGQVRGGGAEGWILPTGIAAPAAVSQRRQRTA
jgi:hypothetical protein